MCECLKLSALPPNGCEWQLSEYSHLFCVPFLSAFTAGNTLRFKWVQGDGGNGKEEINWPENVCILWRPCGWAASGSVSGNWIENFYHGSTTAPQPILLTAPEAFVSQIVLPSIRHGKAREMNASNNMLIFVGFVFVFWLANTQITTVWFCMEHPDGKIGSNENMLSERHYYNLHFVDYNVYLWLKIRNVELYYWVCLFVVSYSLFIGHVIYILDIVQCTCCWAVTTDILQSAPKTITITLCVKWLNGVIAFLLIALGWCDEINGEKELRTQHRLFEKQNSEG